MEPIKIYKITFPIPADIHIQILNLVENNSNEISMNVFSKGSEIDYYMTMREIVRTELYLRRLVENEPQKTHLIVAENHDGFILGYILYHRSIGSKDDISIISTIVSPDHRKQGILRKMVDELKLNYKSISLTCFVSKVDIYKNFGFTPECQIQTQIGMSYGAPGDGSIISIDDDILIKYDSVINAYKKFKNDNPDNWQLIINQCNSDNNIESIKAEKYFYSNE